MKYMANIFILWWPNEASNVIWIISAIGSKNGLTPEASFVYIASYIKLQIYSEKFMKVSKKQSL